MNKSTKQTLLSCWIRKDCDDQADKVKAVPASIEKRKRDAELEEEKEKEKEEKRQLSDDDARRDINLDLDLDLLKENAPNLSSPSASDPDLHDDEEEEEKEPDHGVDASGLTAYERERELLIARNREALARLGVASAAEALLSRSSGGGAPRPPRPARSSAGGTKSHALRASSAFQEEIAVRRSSLRPRRGGLAVAAAATTGAEGASLLSLISRPRTPTPEPETYDNKTVLSYIISGGSDRAKKSKSGGEQRAKEPPSSCSSALPSSLRRLPLVLSGPVVRAYSVSSSRCGSLLVAGGKDGWTCVWGLRGLNDEEEEKREEDDEEDEGEADEERERLPLLSARLHRSWIADVALVSTGDHSTAAESAPLLLTAANDGTLAVHDSGAAADEQKAGKKNFDASSAAPAGAPKRLASATPHAGSGIFSMAVETFSLCSSSATSHFDVATASKDGSLVVSRVENAGGENGIKALAEIEDAHGGSVAKCVRWRDSTTLASCGNDGAVRLWDARCPYGGGGGGAAALEIAEATLGGVAANVVRWRPSKNSDDETSSSFPSNHLLVAGTNPEALMFDVRRPKSALFTLKPPPVSSSNGKSSSSVIFQPCFVARGAAVAVGLPRSRVVSLFDAGTGVPLSRGDVGGHDASTLACFETCGEGGEEEEVVAAVGTRCLHLFSPSS